MVKNCHTKMRYCYITNVIFFFLDFYGEQRLEGKFFAFNCVNLNNVAKVNSGSNRHDFLTAWIGRAKIAI